MLVKINGVYGTCTVYTDAPYMYTCLNKLPILGNQTKKEFNKGLGLGLTGVQPSDRVVMLTEVLILSEEESERGEGLRFSRISCPCRNSCQAGWTLSIISIYT